MSALTSIELEAERRTEVLLADAARRGTRAGRPDRARPTVGRRLIGLLAQMLVLRAPAARM